MLSGSQTLWYNVAIMKPHLTKDIPMNHTKVLNIANDLSNDEIAHLLEIVSNRIDVFVGSFGNLQVTSEIASVCMNGPSVQVNLELAEHDSMMEDKHFAAAARKATEVGE